MRQRVFARPRVAPSEIRDVVREQFMERTLSSYESLRRIDSQLSIEGRGGFSRQTERAVFLRILSSGQVVQEMGLRWKRPSRRAKIDLLNMQCTGRNCRGRTLENSMERPHRHSIGFVRREFIQIGFSGLLGVGLSDLLASRARAGVSGSPSGQETFSREQSR